MENLYHKFFSELLDALSNWILNNHSICRSQDICSLIMTLAVVNFTPTISEKLFEVNRSDFVLKINKQ